MSRRSREREAERRQRASEESSGSTPAPLEDPIAPTEEVQPFNAAADEMAAAEDIAEGFSETEPEPEPEPEKEPEPPKPDQKMHPPAAKKALACPRCGSGAFSRHARSTGTVATCSNCHHTFAI